MNYPLLSEYNAAMHSFGNIFKEMKNLRPVIDESGNPLKNVTVKSVIFKMKDIETGQLFALKCFLEDQARREDSYPLISDDLEFQQSTYLVHATYLEDEIEIETSRSSKKLFSVVLMDWVEGETLDNYIRSNINDKHLLARLAYQFSCMASWLVAQPFAHGNLKPQNIIVRKDGSLTLVDYDNMYLPAMKGMEAREMSSGDFRHPSRTWEIFDEHIDDFAIVSILLSLKAIAIDPDLFKRYGDVDRLLLNEKDYRDIKASALLNELWFIRELELNKVLNLFMIVAAEGNLSKVSPRLLTLRSPQLSHSPIKRKMTRTTYRNMDAWEDEYGGVYSNDMKEFHKMRNKDLKEYYLIEGCVVITCESFKSCGNIERVKLPNSITTIRFDAFTYCRSLSEINIPSSVRTIKASAFHFCVSLKEINIPSGVTTIEKDTFKSCKSLTKVTIPNSVINIEGFAFSYCDSLETITLPNSLVTLGYGAFRVCKKLTSINIPNSVTSIGREMFYECFSLKEATLSNSITEIPIEAFAHCASLERIIIPNSVTSITGAAFKECTSLKEISLPNSITSIGSHTFSNCVSLSAITIPKSLKEITWQVFWNCKSLTEIYIPNSVTHIENGAFQNCSSLIEIFISASVTNLEESIFAGCEHLSRIIIPADAFDLVNLLLKHQNGHYKDLIKMQ